MGTIAASNPQESITCKSSLLLEIQKIGDNDISFRLFSEANPMNEIFNNGTHKIESSGVSVDVLPDPIRNNHQARFLDARY